MCRRLFNILMPAALLFGCLSLPVFAAGEVAVSPTLEQAVEEVRAETGGRILSAETVTKKGRTVHRIKVLTPDHRVRVVNVEAHVRR